MKFCRSNIGAPPDRSGFGEPVHVQSGEVRTRDGDRLVTSGGRFKYVFEGRAALYLLEGAGYIKWARGEVPFSAGDTFSLEGEGELDFYGACVFMTVRE